MTVQPSRAKLMAKQLLVLASPKVSFPPPCRQLHNSLVLESTHGPALNPRERWGSSFNPSSTLGRGGEAGWDPHVVTVEFPIWQPQSLGASHGPEIPLQIQTNLDFEPIGLFLKKKKGFLSTHVHRRKPERPF